MIFLSVSLVLSGDLLALRMHVLDVSFENIIKIAHNLVQDLKDCFESKQLTC
jgi:hypothetical protein